MGGNSKAAPLLGGTEEESSSSGTGAGKRIYPVQRRAGKPGKSLERNRTKASDTGFPDSRTGSTAEAEAEGRASGYFKPHPGWFRKKKRQPGEGHSSDSGKNGGKSKAGRTAPSASGKYPQPGNAADRKSKDFGIFPGAGNDLRTF